MLKTFIPQKFEAALEHEFRLSFDESWKPVRKVATLGCMLLWICLIPWDFYLAHQDTQFKDIVYALVPMRLAMFVWFSIFYYIAFKTDLPKTRISTLNVIIIASLVLTEASLFYWALTVPPNYVPVYFPNGILVVISAAYCCFGLHFRPAVLSFPAVVASIYLCATLTHQSNANLGQVSADTTSVVLLLILGLLWGCLVAWVIETEARRGFMARKRLAKANEEIRIAHAESEHDRMRLLELQDQISRDIKLKEIEQARFLGSAVHDLRQPIQALEAFNISLSRAIHAQDDARAHELSEFCSKAISVIKDQLASILEYTKIQSEAISIQTQAVSVSKLLQNIQFVWQPHAQAADVDLIIQTDAQYHIQSDFQVLLRIIGNLISNSIKYRSRHLDSVRYVSITLEATDSNVTVHVADNGVGIPAEAIESGEIWRPFMQIQKSAFSIDRGVGLGLAIVARLIALLPGHQLRIHSEVGRGTTVSVTLPRMAEASSAALARGFEVESASMSRPDVDLLRGRYVLVIEDDPLVRLSLCTLLQDYGARLESYSDYLSAVKGIQSLERQPDAVISDFSLPDGATAIDVMTELNASWPGTPMMILSGESDNLSDKPGLEHVLCITKPADSAHLLASLCMTMQRAKLNPAPHGA